MKKILLLFIALIASVAAWAWDGSGTSANPYLIKTTDDLVTLATNSATSGYSGKYFRLENDLDMSGVSIEPIGSGPAYFTATFDGNGHAIRNLTISKPDDNYVALFGRVYSGSVIKDLIIDGASITGRDYVGVLVGYPYDATIENCLVVNSSATSTRTSRSSAGIIAGYYSSNITFSGNYYYNCSRTLGSDEPSTTNIGTDLGDKTGIVRATAIVPVTIPDGWGIDGGIYYNGTVYYDANAGYTVGIVKWPALQTALSAASTDADNPTVLTLAADITASSSDTYLTLSGNRHVVLDLNGHTLSRGLTAAITDGHVISVSGSQSTLTIRDSGTGGTITGGWSTNSCGAINFGGATLTIEGGTISGNKVTMQGGSAIRCTGTVYMTGGTITGNMVSMDNYSVNQCGTIYLMNAHFYMSGGSITGNYCGITTGRGSAGIGMSLNYSGVVHLSGNYNISGNQQGTYNSATGEWTDLAPSDILNHKYLLISIDGAINPEAPARLILNSNANDRRPTFTTGWSTYMGMADPEDYFTLADNTLGIGVVNGEATIGTPHAITLGENITASATSAAPGRPITLGYNNLPEGYQVEYTVTIDGSDPAETVPVTNGSFAMPDGDVTVTAAMLPRYTFDSETGVLALLRGEFNKDNKWGSEVTASAVKSVTATSEVSFTGDCSQLFYGFGNCESMDLNNVNTDSVTSMNNMFYWCPKLTTLDLSGWNTENVTDMNDMFSNCSGLTTLDVSGFNTENVTDMNGMFSYCSALDSLDLSGWNTANVTDMSNMFRDCSGLDSLDVSGFNTGNVTSMSAMFYACSALTSLDVSGFNTGNVTYMGRMFYNCSGLTSLDVSGWNTGNITSMSAMFYACSALTSLDVSGWNTANVTNMGDMFYGCSGLTSLDLSGWSTGNVTNMARMFYNCSGLTSLDVSGFNTENVTDMSSMFRGCSGLTSLNVSGFNTGNVTDMGYMFRDCSGLTSLDLSGWNTANVTNMEEMFKGCESLTTLDLSGFNTANVEYMTDMFYYCSGLTTIYAGTGWSTESVEESESVLMFFGCRSLVGGMGTTYDVNHLNAEYARIDGGPDCPGYFTAAPQGVPGDVNGDGEVTASDITALYTFLLSGDMSEIVNGDQDGDGQITTHDVTIVYEILLGAKK